MYSEVDPRQILKFGQDKIAILDCQNLNKMKQFNQQNIISSLNDRTSPIQKVIDTLGQLSADAQGLKGSITSYDKILNSDYTLYFKHSGNYFEGFLKIGYKNLFYYDKQGNVHELKPLCVLDFYVHEQCQREGIGKLLFDKMLQDNNCNPSQLAYDKPSPKLLNFIRKHYNLTQYVPQNNLFVIYDNFFTKGKKIQFNRVETEENKQQNDFMPYQKLKKQPSPQKEYRLNTPYGTQYDESPQKVQKVQQQNDFIPFQKQKNQQSPQNGYKPSTPYGTQQDLSPQKVQQVQKLNTPYGTELNEPQPPQNSYRPSTPYATQQSQQQTPQKVQQVKKINTPWATQNNQIQQSPPKKVQSVQKLSTPWSTQNNQSSNWETSSNLYGNNRMNDRKR